MSGKQGNHMVKNNHLFGRNSTSLARERVAGLGPDRKLLPAFAPLVIIPKLLVVELNDFFSHHRALNDLAATENYKIADHCPLKEKVPQGFQHILLTQCSTEGNFLNEQNYTQWTPEAKETKFYSWFSQKFPSAFRVRLSLLPPDREFAWHIDTNTSVACRCSVALNESNAEFEVKQKNLTQRVPLKENVGTIFFTNTGYPHRVFNHGTADRLNLVFGIGYDGISHYFPTQLTTTNP